MSFDESLFPIGFNQKTTKGELFVIGNHVILPPNKCEKTLEDSSRLSIKVDSEPLSCGSGRSHLQASRYVGPSVSLHVAMLVLHRLKDHFYAILLSWFDPKV